jgi:hypothetical protein
VWLIILLNSAVEEIISEDGTSLCDFLLTKNEGLATLNGNHSSSLAGTAFKLESNLLCGLCLLSENGLGLTSITLLFSIISSLSLGSEGSLTGLVLRHFVNLMLLAFLAVCSSLLWCVDLKRVRASKIFLPFYFAIY